MPISAGSGTWYTTAMDIVEEHLLLALSTEDFAAVEALSDVVYPPEVMAEVHIPASAPPPHLEWPAERAARVFILRHDGQIVATSWFFPRRIHTSRGPLDVLALAGVKTRPEFRGRGLGRRIVRAALEYVDRGTFPVSLFQTNVPEFYEKLNARRVENPFTNRLAADPAATPWWDRFVMIYPARYPWPEGPIELQGPGW